LLYSGHITLLFQQIYGPINILIYELARIYPAGITEKAVTVDI
jgi:hypothetical protein